MDVAIFWFTYDRKHIQQKTTLINLGV